jgi:hypothetical protein
MRDPEVDPNSNDNADAIWIAGAHRGDSRGWNLLVRRHRLEKSHSHAYRRE